MVEHRTRHLDLVFGALADDHRRSMLQRLARGTQTVGALAEPLPITFAATSKHVMVLERAGLVKRERIGREHHITLVEKPLHDAADWATKTAVFWKNRLDQLDDYLNTNKEKKK
jgi:DNA-binding transcriptional ArsR family regulator